MNASATPAPPQTRINRPGARRHQNLCLCGGASLRSAPMSTPNLQVRRATVEDLSKLVELWKQEDLPWENLAKRFQEFQIVESVDGELRGAIGLQITGSEGRLHSEAFGRTDADVFNFQEGRPVVFSFRIACFKSSRLHAHQKGVSENESLTWFPRIRRHERVEAGIVRYATNRRERR